MRNLLLLLCISLLCLSCDDSRNSENQYHLAPYPNSLKAAKGQYVFSKQSKLIIEPDANEALRMVVDEFARQFEKASGIHLPVETSKQNPRGSISFLSNRNIAPEGYRLKIEKKNITIEAAEAIGFFYAIQTIKQLLPLEFHGKQTTNDVSWALPCAVIDDAPRFGYRGMHLDVSRHFFSIEEVKKYIDIIAFHKLNRFHWHLTDDQGWRIEIKSRPQLTKVGSTRKKTMIKKEWNTFDNTPYGGYYTQDEIREVVKYAQERFITIIPEVDLPGHMMAALASYPYLGCTGGPYEVSGQWGIRDDVLCVGKESTFAFLEDVYTEVMELFPSEYIHVGGDECPKVRWEKCVHCQKKIKELGIKSDANHKAEHYLQSYAIGRIEKFINRHGRQIIGWDEILEGGLAPNATVMSWRGMKGGIEAANQSHTVIMTPNTYCYFDYSQSDDTENEPFGIGGHVSLERVYSLEPVPATLSDDKKAYILGAQANLWTEYIETNQHLEYMLLPRLAALSEVQWTQPENKNAERFLQSLPHITDIYAARGYNYAKHFLELLMEGEVKGEQ